MCIHIYIYIYIYSISLHTSLTIIKTLIINCCICLLHHLSGDSYIPLFSIALTGCRCISLSLSLYIYIYMYIYIHVHSSSKFALVRWDIGRSPAAPEGGRSAPSAKGSSAKLIYVYIYIYIHRERDV